MIQVAFPFQLAPDGRTASVDYEEHVRDLIEQVLFTSPGERVNRPTFGSGLMQAVFAVLAPGHYPAPAHCVDKGDARKDFLLLQTATTLNSHDSSISMPSEWTTSSTSLRTHCRMARGRSSGMNASAGV